MGGAHGMFLSHGIAGIQSVDIISRKGEKGKRKRKIKFPLDKRKRRCYNKIVQRR
jgi:hypothetical protein